MKIQRSEAGFTIVELLVAVTIFAITSVGFYSVMFTGAEASLTTEDIGRISEEARAGLNRMIRDTREGQLFAELKDSTYRVQVDWDGDGVLQSPNPDGDYEDMEFVYVAEDNTIRIRRGGTVEVGDVLVRHVEPIPGTPIFDYTSNDLRYDWNGNGVTTKDELEQAATKNFHGISGSDTNMYANVHFAFRINIGDHTTNFRGQAQLRNRR